MKAEKKMHKAIRWLGAALLVNAGLLPMMAEAVTSGTATIQVTIINSRPTCDLTLNDQSSLNYALGKMAPGSQMKHLPFSVKVQCPGNSPVKTAITAKPGGNVVLQPGDDSVRMGVVGTSGVDDNSPLLWLLTDEGKRVKLTGQENDAFCIKTNTSVAPNVCNLTPVTEIPVQSASGEFGATMLIEVVYPQ